MIDASQLFILIAILLTALVGARFLAPYITNVFTLGPSRLDRFLGPVEKRIYWLVGADPSHVMGWREYFLSVLLVNIFQMVLAFFVFVAQGWLPLNPQGFQGLS